MSIEWEQQCDNDHRFIDIIKQINSCAARNPETFSNNKIGQSEHTFTPI